MKVILLIVLLILQLTANSQESNPSIYKLSIPFAPVKELKNDLDLILENEKFNNAHIGVKVYSLTRDEELYDHKSNELFIPASIQKLVTSSSALFFLGEDYHYHTDFYLAGRVDKKGHLYGDIIINSNGDPSWSENFRENPNDIFYEWIAVLDSLGVKSIQGDLIADDSWFESDNYAIGWAWDDLIYSYGSEVSSINFNNNSIKVKIKPGVEMDFPARVTVHPESHYYNIINNTSTGIKNELKEKREFGTNIIELSGSVNINNKYEKVIELSVDDPSEFMLYRFKETLRDNNIRFRGSILSHSNNNLDINYDNLIKLSSLQSPELNIILEELNQESENLYAEILLKTIAKEKTGLGTFSNGIEQIKKLLNDLNINENNYKIYDGSGLSRMNLISPDQLNEIVKFNYKSEHWEAFYNSLAQPGKEGTLENRFVNTICENRLRAKTGTMTSVSNLSAVIETEDGEELLAIIMINNFTQPLKEAQSLQDLISMRLAGFSRIPPSEE